MVLENEKKLTFSAATASICPPKEYNASPFRFSTLRLPSTTAKTAFRKANLLSKTTKTEF